MYFNDVNYSAAQNALITAKVNSKEDSQNNFTVTSFLPYPMAYNGEIKDLEADVAITIFENLDDLPPKLKVALVPFKDAFIGTYYWKSGAFMYR